MARGLVGCLALVGACSPAPIATRPPATTGAPRTAVAPKASGTPRADATPPGASHAPDALIAQQLAPSGTVVEEWVAGPLTDEPREQLVVVARETASDSAELNAQGRRTLLVFDRKDGQWQRRLSAPALLPCASCVLSPGQREVRIHLSLKDRPRSIELSFEHGWVGSVAITLQHFHDAGFMVSRVSQSGASQGLSRGLPVTYWSVSVDPIEGNVVSPSTAVNGEPWFDIRAIPRRWIAADTADYRRLLELLRYDPAHERLPLNPARSLEDFY